MSRTAEALTLLLEAQTQTDIEAMRSMVTSCILLLTDDINDMRADGTTLPHPARTGAADVDPASGGPDNSHNRKLQTILYECGCCCLPANVLAT